MKYLILTSAAAAALLGVFLVGGSTGSLEPPGERTLEPGPAGSTALSASAALPLQVRDGGERQQVDVTPEVVLTDPSPEEPGIPLAVRLTLVEFTPARKWRAVAHSAMVVWLTKGVPGSVDHGVSEHSASVARVTTDADGVLSTTLTVPADWWSALADAQASGDHQLYSACAISLHARPLEPGFQKEPRGIGLSVPLPEVLDKRLTLRRGGNLQVVTRHAGVAIASTVRLLEENHEGVWRSQERGNALGPGHYTIKVDEPGSFVVAARAEGVGTARATVEVSDDFRLPMTIELDLQGSGALTGRLVDPNGTPVLSHGVRAIQTRLQGATYLSTNQQLDHEQGRGCAVGTDTTNADGEFEITGLEPGDYRLLAWDSVTWGEPKLLAEQVSTGTEPGTYTLERHALVVKAVDHQGQPVTVHAHETLGLQDGVQVYCYARTLRPGEYRESLWSREGGDYLMAQLKSDREYVLGIHSIHHAGVEEIVQLSPTDYQEEVVLRLAPPVEAATLDVKIHGPRGTSVDAELRFSVSDRSGYLLIDRRIRSLSTTPTAVSRPPGDYVVRAEEAIYPRFAAVEREIRLEPGEVETETLELGAAGSLAVHVKAAGPPGPSKPFATPDDEIAAVLDGSARGLVIVELTPVGGGSALTMSFPSQGPYVMSHQGPDPGLPFGTKLNATNAIPVGDYTARLTALGYETVERTMTIRERKSSKLVITMKPTR